MLRIVELRDQVDWSDVAASSDPGTEGVCTGRVPRGANRAFADGVRQVAVQNGITVSIGVMIRALFFGLGAFVGLWGMSLVAVDGVVLNVSEDAQPSRMLQAISQLAPDGRRMIDPPDWIGFTLVGMGGLTMLYSVALPRS